MSNSEARGILRSEFDGEDGSFLIQIRCEFRWDWEAFRRLTAAMYDVAEEVRGQAVIEKWITEGFWFCDTWIRDFTGHPDFPRPPEEDYRDALELLHDLAWFLFVGESLFTGDELWRKAKG